MQCRAPHLNHPSSSQVLHRSSKLKAVIGGPAQIPARTWQWYCVSSQLKRQLWMSGEGGRGGGGAEGILANRAPPPPS